MVKPKLKYLFISIVVTAVLSEVITMGAAFSKEGGAQKEAVQNKAAQVKTAENNKGENKENVSSDSPVFEVRRLKTNEPRYSIELRGVELGDLFRVFAHDYKFNFLVDKGVKGKVTASFTNISLEEALERIAQMNNLALKKEGNVIIVKPNLITKMFILRYIEADKLLGISRNKQGQKEQGEGEKSMATIYDLLSPEGKILSGPQSNSIVVIDYPPNVEKVKNFITAVDQKMSRKVFKLKYLSVKDLFPSLISEEINRRKEQRDEREKESDEIKGIRGTAGAEN
ncbi:MAG: hypothetical protein B1H08_05160 [Candidatus Omnitrophica bacterium 4484_171]|nr:MAG: hypothetical protein B1H08_05160 [Candidatus Omnitrophica bacterium 4484_171]